MRRDGTPGQFDGEYRAGAFDESKHHDSQNVIVGVLFFIHLGHARCEGAKHAVTQQDSKERSYKRGSYFVADLFGRSAQRSHRDHDSQYRRHDTETGKGIGDRVQRAGWQAGAVMVDVHIQLHHLIDIEGLDATCDRHAHRVADEILHMVVFEKLGILGKNGALVRTFDVRLNRHKTFFAGFGERSNIIFRVSR